MNTLGNTARHVTLLIASLSALLMLGGCNAVLVEAPMGDAVVTLDPATWQGTWASNEVVILTTVLDSEKGLLQAAWVERGGEGEGARFESVSGTVRQTGDMLFLNMEQEPFIEAGAAELAALATPEATPEATEATEAATPAAAAAKPIPAKAKLLWGRITNDGKRTILWMPDVEQFQQAVKDGRLPGTVTDNDDVVLGPLDPAQLELINSPAGNLLDWTEPLVFVRIGD